MSQPELRLSENGPVAAQTRLPGRFLVDVSRRRRFFSVTEPAKEPEDAVAGARAAEHDHRQEKGTRHQRDNDDRSGEDLAGKGVHVPGGALARYAA
jgi:hypothetical protein